MKKQIHFLRFNNELEFNFDPNFKTYSIQSGHVVYVMPYVLTLRLKRYLKVNSSPSAQQLNDWYQNLPKTEKSLVTCNGISGIHS
ncbi:MAG: hypothetical protein LH478_12440 [Chitinophagaceae bacterium]|nr:hypothetical protein [Chitinophagaceae bacterium]